MENKAVYQNYQNCNWGSRSTCTFELSTKIQFWKLYNIFKKKKKKKTSTKGGKHIYNQLLRTSFSHKMTSSFPQHTWNGILYPKSDFKVPGIDLLWCSPLLHILCRHLKVTTTPICNYVKMTYPASYWFVYILKWWTKLWSCAIHRVPLTEM